MAHLTYQTADGQTKSINNYKVNNILLADEMGNDPTSAISQKAATDGIKEVDTKVEGVKSDVQQIQSDLSTKASQSDLTELEGKVSKETADRESAISKEVTDRNEAIESAKGELETSISTKADKEEFNSFKSEVDEFMNDDTIEGGEF